MKLEPAISKRIVRTAKTAATAPSRTPQVRVNGRNGTIFISCPALAEAAQLPTRRELIDRLFSIHALRALRLDPARGSAWLSFEGEAVSVPEALEGLAVALRARTPPRHHLPHEELLVTTWAHLPVAVWRAERGLTFWQVEELHADRFRLSHPLLRHPPIREKTLDAVAAVAGVTHLSTSIARPASIEVRCQPHRINAAILLEVVERALADYPSLLGENRLAIRGTLVVANLALAPISDFVFAPLGIANAVIVWALNVEHAAGAWRALRERRGNLELLYLCIGACTLLTFHFFGSAVMYGALELWPRLVRRLRSEGQRQFLARYRRCPQRVWIERDGTLLETSLADLPAGQVLVLREGDIVPGDGVVLEGRADVREAWITGAPGATGKQPGDALYASTELVQGEVRAQIDTVGERTVAGRLTSWFAQALRQPSSNAKAARFADSMVIPALFFGAAALGRGGLHMAKAVIRPDFFTGPAIAEELSELLTIIQAAEAGFYIADPGVLDRLAETDCWIFDDSVPWAGAMNNGRTFAAQSRAQGIREVLFLSSQPAREAAAQAGQLGFDGWRSGCTAEAKKDLIAHQQFLGQNVAYFGDCTRQIPAAEQANIAISVLGKNQYQTPAAPIALLRPDLARCGALYSLSRARASSVSAAFTASVVPNVAAMTGAIYLDFSVIYTVILTNLGTLASYYRWRRTLRSVQ